MSQNNWHPVSLGELIEVHDSKRVPLSGADRSSMQGAFRYYGASGVIDHIDKFIFDGKYLLIAEDGENLNSRKLPVAFIVEGQFWVNNHAHIVTAKRGKSSIEFLKHWFAGSSIAGYITGAAQPKLSQKNLKKITFQCPSFEAQQKIAAILTAYDDLIENNRQRIALLEKMAEEIYREWFVRLRFPEHEHTPMHKGVPEGADVAPLRDHIGHYIGGGWGAESPEGRENEPVHVIRGTDFDAVASGDVSTVPLRFEKSSSIDSRKLQPGDIVMENSVNHASRTSGKSILITPGILNLLGGNVICASFCKLLRPKRYEYSKLLHLSFKLIFEQGLFEIYQNVATNGIANLQIERFLDRHLIMIPPNIDFRKLNSFDVSSVAQMQAHLLTTRDLLLNRLISGKLRVDDLDIQFPPSMQEETA